jgi:hypothetical protein
MLLSVLPFGWLMSADGKSLQNGVPAGCRKKKKVKAFTLGW